MNVCRWKGTKKNGRILCGKPLNEVESITTDDSVITCKECLLLSGKRTGVKQTHLNADFLSFANIGENGLLDFQEYKKEKDGRSKTGYKDSFIMCRSESPNYFVPEHRITNDPKEVSCSHCLNMWGKKETKRFVLTGVMLEIGLPMKKIRTKVDNASSATLSSMLDKMLYGDKV